MEEARAQRHLAAILAADVVGYSRLMGRDEAGTLATLKTLRAEVFDPRSRQCRGRIFKIAGDCALRESSARSIRVLSAMEIRRILAARNTASRYASASNGLPVGVPTVGARNDDHRRLERSRVI
jgi:adenylate cyclase